MSPGCSLGRCLDGGQPWHMQHVFLSAHWRTQRQLAVLAARLIFHGSVVCLSVVYPLPIQPFCLRVWVWFVCQSVRFCFWTHVHAQMHTHTVMHTHTYTLAKRHACTHTRHTHTHARAKTHTQTHIHTHTHTLTHALHTQQVWNWEQSSGWSPWDVFWLAPIVIILAWIMQVAF